MVWLENIINTVHDNKIYYNYKKNGSKRKIYNYNIIKWKTH